MTDKKAKSQALNRFDPNPIETVKSVGSSVSKAVSEEIKNDAKNTWEMLLGIGSFGKTEGDMQEGEEIDLMAKKKAEENKKEEQQLTEKKTKLKNIEVGINYTAEVIHAEKRVIQETNREIKMTVQEIIVELGKIKSASKEIEREIKDVDTLSLPENPGKYHISFFEWVLSVVRTARMKIEDSKMWMNQMSAKSAKKTHWTQNKKQGTQFGLSGERIVATQTG
jgi:hypothetical protein